MSMATLRAGRVQEPLRVGDPLPTLKGQLLTGRDAALPQAASGKSHPSRDRLHLSVPRSGRSVGGLAPQEVRLEGGRDVARGADDRLGWQRWAAGSSTGECAAARPVDLHDRVITVYGGTGEWKRRLSYSPEHKDDAYLIAVDREGVRAVAPSRRVRPGAAPTILLRVLTSFADGHQTEARS